jgi:hypothetical protein
MVRTPELTTRLAASGARDVSTASEAVGDSDTLNSVHDESVNIVLLCVEDSVVYEVINSFISVMCDPWNMNSVHLSA